MPATLIEERGDDILTLILNRPEQRNALNRELISSLQRSFVDAARDATLKAVIIRGNGPAFCAGLDLEELSRAAEDPHQGRDLTVLLYDLLEHIASCPVTVIAAVHGFAVAGGAALMNACDVVVAAQGARIGYPGIKRGLVAAVVMRQLIRQVGMRHARYLLITGDTVTANSATQMGLVDEVVSHADLLLRSTHVARQAATLPADSVRLTKKWLHEAAGLEAHQLRDFSTRMHIAPPDGTAGA